MKAKALWALTCMVGFALTILGPTQARTSFPGIALIGYPFTWKRVYIPCWGEPGPPTEYRYWVLGLYLVFWVCIFVLVPQIINRTRRPNHALNSDPAAGGPVLSSW